MTRRLWIAGLTFALLFYGGWEIAILIVGLRHRHLGAMSILILVGNGYLTWFIFQYLLTKIRNTPDVPLPVEEEEIQIPRLL